MCLLKMNIYSLRQMYRTVSPGAAESAEKLLFLHHNAKV